MADEHTDNPDKPDKMDRLSEAYRQHYRQHCAYTRLTAWQLITILAVVAGILTALLCDPVQTAFLFSIGVALMVSAIILQRLLALLISWVANPTISLQSEVLLPDETLPHYAVLVPLYKEPAVVPTLMQALQAIDYPTSKLDIILLLEADDELTAKAIDAQTLPSHIRRLVAPSGQPRTKPRACNYGLDSLSEAELLVIFDAEDRPDPDQLRKAASVYATADPRLACLQCRLAHYNSRQSLLTAWTAMDYLLWFRDFLPGLRRLGWPIPLGGTSNHFKVSVLQQLRGWDPFNVTEDADLGLRLSRAGYRVELLDSTTWEEAVPYSGAWIGQRSRWLKGYLQTTLVHTRLGSVKELGLWAWSGAQLLIAGTVVLALINPLCWAIILAWLVSGWSLVDVSSPLSQVALAVSLVLLVCNILLVVLGSLSCLRHQRADLVPAALMAPGAWFLQSLAAWRAVVEMMAIPFFWAKTEHGGQVQHDADRQPHAAAILLRSIAACVVLTVLSMLFVQRSLQHVQHDVERQTAPIAVQLPLRAVPRAKAMVDMEQLLGRSISQDIPIHGKPGARWTWHSAAVERVAGYEGLVLRIHLPADAPDGFRLLWFVQDEEQRWFQQLDEQWLLPGREAILECDWTIAADWSPQGHERQWHPQLRHNIHAFGFSIECHAAWQGQLSLKQLSALDLDPEQSLLSGLATAVEELQRPEPALQQMALAEWSYAIDAAWPNPFALSDVKAQLSITRPSGRQEQVDGFWFQDYERALLGAEEQLLASGAPHWRWRWRPQEIGDHQWLLSISDPTSGQDVELAAGQFSVSASQHPGYIQRSRKDPRYLVHGNGAPWWPIGHNLCQAVDLQQPYPYDFKVPPDQGTYSYDRYFARMQAAGMDWARLWLTPWSFGIEGFAEWPGFRGIGRYNLENAWRLDYLLASAERHGIRLVLTTTHKSAWKDRKRKKRRRSVIRPPPAVKKTGNWTVNPYNRANGGPLERASEFFSNAEARQSWRDYLRYLVARWGHSPNIVAWEFFGECNLMPGFDPLACADWHDDLTPWLKELDHNRHLVFTHAHNWQRGHELWRLPSIDCVQGNGYIRHPNKTPNHIINFKNYLDEVEHYGKPVFVAEYGGRSELGAPNKDYLEAQLHSGIWASAVQPFAGVAFQWWWNFTDGADLYFHYRALADVMQHIDHLRHHWQAADWSLTAATVDHKFNAAAFACPDRALVWVYHDDCFTRWADLPSHEQLSLDTDHLQAGRYRLRCWHTHGQGLVTDKLVECGPGKRVALPRIDKDLVLLLEPE